MHQVHFVMCSFSLTPGSVTDHCGTLTSTSVTAITVFIKAAMITAKNPLRSEALKLLMFPQRRKTPPSQLYKMLPQLSIVLGGAEHTEGSRVTEGRTPPHSYGEASSMWEWDFQ